MGLLPRINFKKVLQEIGLTKKNIASATPFIAAINPVVGGIAGVLTHDNPLEGLTSALTGAALSSVVTGTPLLSAGGKLPGLQKAITTMFKQPNSLVKNTVLTGGNVSAAIVKTLASGEAGEEGQNLLRDPNIVSALLGGIGGNGIGGGQIDLGQYGLNDAIGFYSIIEYLKSKPPTPPSPATYQFMDQEAIDRMFTSYSDILDDELAESLIQARENYGARGLYRSGLLGEQEMKLRENAAKQKAMYKAQLLDEQMKYNNTLKQQAYNDYMRNYEVLAGLDAQKMESLGALAGDWLASKSAPPPQYSMAQPTQPVTSALNMFAGKVNTPVTGYESFLQKYQSNPANQLDTSIPANVANDPWISGIPDIQLKV